MKLLATLLFAAALLPAASFQVSIDTSLLDTQAGTIDIQFNPGSFPAVYNAGTATISNFILTGGTLGSLSAGPDGGATGTLPGPLTIVNSDFLNGVVYNATFGTGVSFLVDFTGAAFTGTGQSILTTLYVGLTGTGTTLAAQADLIGGSQIDSSVSSGEVTFTPQSAVPEPSTFGLLAAGCLVVIFRRRA